MALPGKRLVVPDPRREADYLEEYATRFAFPVQSNVRVDRLSGNGNGYDLTTHSGQRIEADNAAAGIECVPRVVGVVDGLPVLTDRRVLKVSNVVWCTGFHPDFSWIDLPGSIAQDPWRDRGVITHQPGLFFVGLLFLYAMSSSMIHGVGRGAEHVANLIALRMNR